MITALLKDPRGTTTNCRSLFVLDLSSGLRLGGSLLSLGAEIKSGTNSFISALLIGLVVGDVDLVTGDTSGRGRKNEDGELVVNDKIMLLLVEGRIVDEEVVVETLLKTETSVLAIERAKSEGENGVFVVDFSHDGSGGLDLEEVGLLDVSSVDHGTSILLGGLALTGGKADIDGVDLVLLEGAVVDLLGGILTGNDDLVAINNVLLHLVHEGSLDEVDAVGLSDLGEKRGNLVVLSAGGDELLAELAHVVGGAHEVVEDGGSLSAGNDAGLSDNGDETVDVATHIDLADIAGLEDDALLGVGGVVANAIVDGNAGREGDALLDLLVGVDALALLGDQKITEGAEVGNLLSSGELLHGTSGRDVP